MAVCWWLCATRFLCSHHLTPTRKENEQDEYQRLALFFGLFYLELKGRSLLNFVYKYVRAEILSALENVEDATIYFPDYDVEPISIVGQLRGYVRRFS